jgi:Domain of unknown function (DUF4190)
MSDIQQGPEWWQATDGKWYPPETHPLRRTPAPEHLPGRDDQIHTTGYGGAPTVPPATYPTGPTGYPTGPSTQPGAGYPNVTPTGVPSGYPQWGSTYSPYGVPPGAAYAPAQRTNGLAIASLVCSAAGVIPLFFGIPCVVGIVLGFVALGQIKGTGRVQPGRGLAIAGVAIGFSLIAIFIVIVILVATAHRTN